MRPYARGEVIDESPVLVIPGDQWPLIEQTVLADHCFRWGPNDEDAALVLPTAMRLFNRARTLAGEATEAGALREGSSDGRAVIVLAGTTGVLLTSGLARREPSSAAM